MNPSGKLREWFHVEGRDTAGAVIGNIFDHKGYPDGAFVIFRGLKAVHDYKNHVFFVTQDDEYIYAHKTHKTNRKIE